MIVAGGIVSAMIGSLGCVHSDLGSRVPSNNSNAHKEVKEDRVRRNKLPSQLLITV